MIEMGSQIISSKSDISHPTQPIGPYRTCCNSCQSGCGNARLVRSRLQVLDDVAGWDLPGWPSCVDMFSSFPPPPPPPNFSLFYFSVSLSLSLSLSVVHILFKFFFFDL